MNIVCKYDESSVELEASTINLLELAETIQQIDGVQLFAGISICRWLSRS
jgi:hypothetical protein